MNHTIKEAAIGTTLLTTSAVAQVVSSMPDPEQINNAMSMLTQIIVLVVTLWRAIKRPKPNNQNNG